jgi:hypothetical protein
MTPVVKKDGDVYSVEIAHGAIISWSFQDDPGGTMVTIRIKAPSRTYWTDATDNRVSFPVNRLQ